MSEKFDNFGKQLQELITTINLIKEENSILKEENHKLKNEFASLEKRLNLIEQKSIETLLKLLASQRLIMRTVSKRWSQLQPP